MGDVGDAGAVLLWIQIVVAYDYGAGITRVQLLKQSSHGSLLRLSARVGGLTADVIPALIADADRVGIMVLAVGPDHPFHTTGAGDAFFAGLSIALSEEESLEEACHVGAYLAAQTISTIDSVCPPLSLKEFGL